MQQLPLKNRARALARARARKYRTLRKNADKMIGFPGENFLAEIALQSNRHGYLREALSEPYRSPAWAIFWRAWG